MFKAKHGGDVYIQRVTLLLSLCSILNSKSTGLYLSLDYLSLVLAH